MKNCIGLFLLTVLIGLSSLHAEPCRSSGNLMAYEAASWSSRKILFGEFYEVACDRQRPRSLEEIGKILREKYQILILNIATDNTEAAVYYKNAIGESQGIVEEYWRQMADFESSNTSPGTIEALFVAPSYYSEKLGKNRPYFNKLLMVLGENASRRTILHEFAHYLLWRDNADVKQNATDQQSRSRAKYKPWAERLKLDLSSVVSLKEVPPGFVADSLEYRLSLLVFVDSIFGEEIDVTGFLVHHAKNLDIDPTNERTYSLDMSQKIMHTILTVFDGWFGIMGKKTAEMSPVERATYQKIVQKGAELKAKLTKILEPKQGGSD